MFLASLPLLLIASCGPQTNIEKINITIKSDITQIKIDKAISAYSVDGATNDDKIIALNQVFDGITPENHWQFTSSPTNWNGFVSNSIYDYTFDTATGDDNWLYSHKKPKF